MPFDMDWEWQYSRGETSRKIEEFSRAFGRPVNSTPQEKLSDSDRVLLGKLLLEETLEYITKGLGLRIDLQDDWFGDISVNPDDLTLIPTAAPIDLVQCADGLGDVNVVVHFNALWHGIHLDAVTREIHRSNMSKLGLDGKPIINDVTPGYRSAATMCEIHNSGWKIDEDNYDPEKPAGKILKGPRYSPPNLLPILGITPNEEEE